MPSRRVRTAGLIIAATSLASCGTGLDTYGTNHSQNGQGTGSGGSGGGPPDATAIVLYLSTGTFKGDVGNRSTTSAICAGSTGTAGVVGNFQHGFVAVLGYPSDSIEQLPNTIPFVSTLPVNAPNGTQIAPTWDSLIANGPGADLHTFDSAAFPNGGVNFWTGVKITTGTMSFDATNACENLGTAWNTTSPSGDAGSTGSPTQAGFFSSVATSCISQINLLCGAFP
jgi:hypothetical protein